jgi:Glucose / Sorbosone dehydrogenase
LPAGFSDATVGGGWNEAVGITFASDGRMFVWERAGRIWIVENGVKTSTSFLDISPEVGGWRDFGLLGFCLHPDFYTNGYRALVDSWSLVAVSLSWVKAALRVMDFDCKARW